MHWKLVIVAICCGALQNTCGLLCNSCNDITSCESPATVTCTSTVAWKTFSSLFSSAYEPPADTSFGCISANISFDGSLLQPILTLGCGFSNQSSYKAKPSTTPISPQYSSCITDLCNSFSTTTGPSASTEQPILSTIQPFTSNTKCLQCQGEQCDRNSANFSVYSSTCDDFNSLTLYQELSPFLNLQSLESGYECISFFGYFNSSLQNESIIYEGCIRKGSGICGASLRSGIEGNFDCNTCQTDYCNNLNISIPAAQNSISCYSCNDEPCGDSDQVQCSSEQVASTLSRLSPGYNFTVSSGAGSNNYECLFLNASVSKNGGEDKDLIYKGCIYSDLDVCNDNESHFLPGYSATIRNCSRCSGDLCNKTNRSSTRTISLLSGLLIFFVISFRLT